MEEKKQVQYPSTKTLTIRIEKAIVLQAKELAPTHGKSVGEYISDLLRDQVEREYGAKKFKLNQPGES